MPLNTLGHALQEEYELFEECFLDANAKPVLSNNTARCDIKISGVDKQVGCVTHAT